MPPSVWTAESDIQRSGRLPFLTPPAGASSCLGVAPSLSRLRARVSMRRLQLRKNCLAAGGCDCPPRKVGMDCCRFGSNRGLEPCLSDGTESHGRRSVWSLDPGAIASAARLCVCHSPRWAYHPGLLPCSGSPPWPPAAAARPPAEVRRRLQPSCDRPPRCADILEFLPPNAQGSAVARVRPDQSNPV